MFNNNINKPAITVFLPLTSAKTSFCQWLPAKTIFARSVFSAEKNGFYRSLAKTCQPWVRTRVMFIISVSVCVCLSVCVNDAAG